MVLFEVLIANMMLICGANNIKITGYCMVGVTRAAISVTVG